MAVTTWTAGQVLAAADLNDTFASKLDLAGGKILQIVRATDTTDRTTTSLSFVDVTGMSVTITPQKSDSAVLLIAAFSAQPVPGTGSTMRTQLTDASNNAISGAELTITGTTASDNFYVPATQLAYATPATTSAITYKLRFLAESAGMTARVRNSQATGQMYAIEVSA